MYIRVNLDRNNPQASFWQDLEKATNRFFRVCYWDGYENIWFNIFE